MTKKNASSILYMILFLVIFLAFCTFAVDSVIVFNNRTKLQDATEMTAMTAASESNVILAEDFHNPDCADVASHVKKTAEETFDLLKKDNLQTATMVVDTSALPKVTVTTKMVSQPFFLRFLGVSGINLEAKAMATSESPPVRVTYNNDVNWITAITAWHTNIIQAINPPPAPPTPQDFHDTAILNPLGGYASASYNQASTPKQVDYSLIESGNDPKGLSLGPGGFITIRLPDPIVDKTGYDLSITEAGNALEGYMVFAGLDVNPENPYTSKDKPGEGIYWVNISCTGDPVIKDSNNKLGAYTVQTTNQGSQTRIYGSAKFDIRKKCTDGFNGISMAKYIRIVDDNSESAFFTPDTSNATTKPYYQIMQYGEASSATAGADISGVTVLNHVRLTN